MKRKELQDLFDKYDILGNINVAYGELDHMLEGSGVKAELVYESDWGEDMGTNIEVVYKIVKDDVTFVKFKGYYNSWDSDEMEDDFWIVEPYQELVTKYKEVK